MAHVDLKRPEHAYFFGFAQTDGSLYAGVGQKGRFTIELSQRDEAVLHSFAALFDVYSRVSYRERVTNFGEHSAAVWTVSNLGFRCELIALGLRAGRKAAAVAPPVTTFSERDYLRGLVDGDGSVGFTRTGLPFISFVTASQALADFFCAQVYAVTGAHRTPGKNTRDGVFNPMVAGSGRPTGGLALPVGVSRARPETGLGCACGRLDEACGHARTTPLRGAPMDSCGGRRRLHRLDT